MEQRVRTKERHEEAPRERPLAPKKGQDANGKSRLSSVANAIRLIKAFPEDEHEIGIGNLAGPVQRVRKRVLEAYVPEVLATADAISQRLGCAPGHAMTLGP